MPFTVLQCVNKDIIIIIIFYEMNPRDAPVFVAHNLNNVLPMSMNKFDMSHMIEQIGIIKNKMAILQAKKPSRFHYISIHFIYMHVQLYMNTWMSLIGHGRSH